MTSGTGAARGRAVTQHAHPNAHAVKSRNRGFINKRAEHSRLEYVERATFIHNYRCYGCVNVTSMTNQNVVFDSRVRETTVHRIGGPPPKPPRERPGGGRRRARAMADARNKLQSAEGI